MADVVERWRKHKLTVFMSFEGEFGPDLIKTVPEAETGVANLYTAEVYMCG